MPLHAGFDLGGTELKYGLIDEKGRIVLRGKKPSPPSMEELLRVLSKTWKQLKDKKGREILSCGFGFPGIFNLKEKKIFQSPNYPHLDGYELEPALSAFIDVPFSIDNDANVAALGEYLLGSDKGVQSLILITIGTGIGTGIILEGKIWHGKCGYAGELGHVSVRQRGKKCKCGSRGCLETEVSAQALVRKYKSFAQTEEELEAREIFQRAKAGDENALKAYAEAGRYLGIGLSIVINLLNPDRILLGGGVMKASKLLLFPALQEAKKRSYKAAFESCKIQMAFLGNDAGFIGAALLGRERILAEFKKD